MIDQGIDEEPRSIPAVFPPRTCESTLSPRHSPAWQSQPKCSRLWGTVDFSDGVFVEKILQLCPHPKTPSPARARVCGVVGPLVLSPGRKGVGSSGPLRLSHVSSLVPRIACGILRGWGQSWLVRPSGKPGRSTAAQSLVVPAARVLGPSKNSPRGAVAGSGRLVLLTVGSRFDVNPLISREPNCPISRQGATQGGSLLSGAFVHWSGFPFPKQPLG